MASPWVSSHGAVEAQPDLHGRLPEPHRLLPVALQSPERSVFTSTLEPRGSLGDQPGRKRMRPVLRGEEHHSVSFQGSKSAPQRQSEIAR